METNAPSPRAMEDRGFFSCWGRLKSKLAWPRERPIRSSRRSSTSGSSSRTLHRPIVSHVSGGLDCKSISSLAVVQPKAVGGFKYDPFSYAQNFDEGCWNNDDIEGFRHGFSSRYAAPNSSRSVMASNKLGTAEASENR